MLPFLRMISVGGVFLAISILALALIPPGGSHLVLATLDAPARGALIDRSQHPEWRQLMIRAALQRAGELDRLRDLPSSSIATPDVQDVEPVQSAPADIVLEKGPAIVGLPSTSHSGPELQDVTGSIDDNPGATIPIDIGATSSSELPVLPTEEWPPVIQIPQLQPSEAAPDLSGQVSALAQPENTKALPPVMVQVPLPPSKVKISPPPRRAVQRNRRKPAPARPAPVQTQSPPPFNILEAIFSSLANPQRPVGTAPAQSAPTVQAPSATIQSSGIRPASGPRIVPQ